MKLFKYILFIFLFTMLSIQFVEASKLSWKAPTTNADGTPLKDLAGYNIYRGVDVTFEIIATVGADIVFYEDILTIDGEYKYYVTAFDFSGNESLPSNIEVYLHDTTPPDSPLLNTLVALRDNLNNVVADNSRLLRDQLEEVRVAIQNLEDTNIDPNIKSKLTTLRFQTSGLKNAANNINSFRSTLVRLLDDFIVELKG